MYLQAKKYRFRDLCSIPIRITPIYSTAIILNYIILGLIPVMNVVLLGELVDTAILVFEGQVLLDKVIPLFVLMIGLIAYQFIQETVMTIIKSKFQIKLMEKYHIEVIEKRARLKYEHIEDNKSLDLISRVCSNDVGRLIEGFNFVLQVGSMGLRMGSLVLLVAQSIWWIAVLIVLISVPVLRLSIKLGKIQYEVEQEVSKNNRKANYLNSLLTSREYVEERTLFGYTEELSKKWKSEFEMVKKSTLKMEAKNLFIMNGSGIITILICTFIAALLIIPLNEGHLTLGFFTGLIIATFDLVGVMTWELPWNMRQFSYNQEYIRELSEFSQLSEVKDALTLSERINDFELKSIEFRKVTFKYPKTEKLVLNKFSLVLKGNKRYAIVGTNGAGKTTLTKLLLKLYEDYEGEILINAKNLRDYSYAEIKAIFAVVHQDFAKYQISVKDNLSIGMLNVDTEKETYDELEKLGLLEVINQLPQGIDTYLGKIKEEGTDLSGGQWQKIAIARGLMRRAPITILDEPTAALDPVAESAVYKLFDEMSKGRSTISITHRLGASKQADEIIVLHEGVVAEQGNHQELMACKGIYAEMFNSQRSWYQ